MLVISKLLPKLPPLIKQFFKFGVVGVVNTLITIALIWAMLHWLKVDVYKANIVGYVAGLINSFIWNRKWTFRSKESVKSSLTKFLLIFVISYFTQLGVLYLLLHVTSLNDFVSQLVSMIIYVIMNFFLNKNYAFKNK